MLVKAGTATKMSFHEVNIDRYAHVKSLTHELNFIKIVTHFYNCRTLIKVTNAVEALVLIAHFPYSE